MAAVQAPDVPAQGPALKPLSRPFYARPSPIVARDLLGRVLVRRLGGVTVSGRIVETEAYREDDPASHSFAGRTARTEVMFGPPGHVYVYFTYGMHFCMNVVTEAEGRGSAVLLRAIEPLEGADVMAARRGLDPARPWLLCSGPAKLTEAFGVGMESNGADLVVGDVLFVGVGSRLQDDRVGVGPRIGIRRAADVPWRFYEAGNPFVSPGGSARASPDRAVRARSR